MGNFLSKAEDLIGSELLTKEEKSTFTEVIEAIHRLKGISYQLKNDLTNIENIFGLLDMGRMLGILGDVPQDKIDRLFLDIQKVMGLTIDLNTTVHPNDNGKESLKGPINRLATLFDKIYLHGGASDAAVITFNYDMALEYALYEQGRLPNYYINKWDDPSFLPILKLHGSLNWALNSSGKLEDWSIKSILANLRDSGQHENSRIIVSRYLFDNNTTLGFKTNGPFLVPPTWNKNEYHQKIGMVWKKAVDFLSKAQAIYVIGYSMPETDLFFKHLLSLATYSPTNIRQLWVFDPAPAVEERFKKIIGDGLKHAFVCRQIPLGEAPNYIVKENNYSFDG